MDIVTLKDIVTAGAFGVLAPALAYQAVKKLREKKPQWTYFAAWWASATVAPAIALVFWGFGLLMAYYPPPGVGWASWRAWVETIFAISYPVAVAAAGIHAAIKTASLPGQGRKCQ
jgi:hypothetical protein